MKAPSATRKHRLARAFATLFILWLTTGCALTPHAFHLRRQERLYIEALSRIKPGQTRADLNEVLPQAVESKAWSAYRAPHRPFDTELYKIDADFYLMVDFDYRSFRRIPGPLPPRPLHIKGFGSEYITIHAIGDIRAYPYGTPYYRIHPQKDDRLISIGTHVSRSDGDLIYITPMAQARYSHQ